MVFMSCGATNRTAKALPVHFFNVIRDVRTQSLPLSDLPDWSAFNADSKSNELDMRHFRFLLVY